MKVQINGQIFDADDTPILLILSPKDKENIGNMEPRATKYLRYPDHMDPADAQEYLDQCSELP